MQLKLATLSLKARVTVALVASVSLFVAMQGWLAYLSMEEQEDELVDALVLAESRRLATHIGADEQNGMRATDLLTLSPNFSGWLMPASGPATPGPLPAYLERLSPGPHRLHADEQELHVFVMPTAEGTLYVQYDAGQNEEKVRQFGLYLLALSLLCMGLGVAVARYVAAVVVAPIERLTRQLGGWLPTTPTAATSTEEAQLMSAFAAVQSRFEQAVAHEREFVANARHEIRTPLSALRTDLEMLAIHADPALQPRLQRALASVDAITGSLDLAHTLAHQQSVPAQPVALARCVEDAWVSLEGVLATASVSFSHDIAENEIVQADRHALLTILRNLMRNAVEHGRPTQCRVALTARGIEVVDDGVGIPAQDLPFVFDRHYRARRLDSPAQTSPAPTVRGERGLGLAIARQLADLNGWQLRVESAEGQGCRFILTLSPR